MSDYFIASDDELKRLVPGATNKCPGQSDSDIDLLMLCNLESILTGDEWENVFDQVYINPVRDHSPDGPLIYRVSKCLLDALRNLNHEGLRNCARLWAESDEWTLRDDCAFETIMNALNMLVDLAKAAAKLEKDLFILTMP